MDENNDPKPPAPDAPTPNQAEGARRPVFALVDWLCKLATPMKFEDVERLQDEVEAGRVTLTDREKQILSTAGMVIGNAAQDHAGRMFQRAIGSVIMRAEVAANVAHAMGMMGDDDEDDPDGGGKPS